MQGTIALSMCSCMHHGFADVFLLPQCFELLNSFLGRGYKEIDTALMYGLQRGSRVVVLIIILYYAKQVCRGQV